MNIEEIKNNYLLSIGCSIKDTYTFIPDSNKSFFEEKIDNTISINDLNISINNKLLNNKKLNDIFYVSINSFFYHINNMFKEKLKGNFNSNLVVELVGNYNAAQITYYSDFFKFVINKLPVTEEIVNLLITLTNNAISNSHNEIDKLLQKYNMKLNEINMEAIAHQQRLNAKSMAEFANSPSYTISTHYPYSSFGASGYTMSSTFSSVSSENINVAFSADSFVSNLMKESSIDRESKEFVKEMIDKSTSILSDFNKKVKEILEMKLTNIFEDIDENSKSVEICPYNIRAWFNCINEIKDEDFHKLNTIFEYYNLDFAKYIENSVINNMYNYYVSNQYSDYNGNDLKIYMYLKKMEDIKNIPFIADKVYNHFYSNIDQKFRNDDLNFDETLNNINNSKYLTEELKNKLINLIDYNIKLVKSNQKQEVNNRISNIFLILIGIILELVLLGVMIFAEENTIRELSFVAFFLLPFILRSFRK